MNAKEPRYTQIVYVPIADRRFGKKEAFQYHKVSFYLHGSLPAEQQLTMFDTVWAYVADDSVTADDIPQDTPILELADIERYHFDCLRRHPEPREEID